MAFSKISFYAIAFLLLLALSHAAPAEKPIERPEKDDLVAEKDDLKPAASHWGGHYGGLGYGYGGYWGGHYPYYGSYLGYPGYGYGYGWGGYPYYGGYGFGGYWW